MENVGTVIYSDDFLVPVDERTNSKAATTAYLFLHELSHMWFGDLVTMRWWGDLWLKESFADFMSVLCMTDCKAALCAGGKEEIYGHPEIRHSEFINHALEADVRRSLTHPI